MARCDEDQVTCGHSFYNTNCLQQQTPDAVTTVCRGGLWQDAQLPCGLLSCESCDQNDWLATVMWVMLQQWLTWQSCHFKSNVTSCHHYDWLDPACRLNFVTIRCTRIEFYSCESGCWLLSLSYESKWIKLTMTRRVYTRVVTRGCKTGSIGRHGVILTVEI